MEDLSRCLQVHQCCIVRTCQPVLGALLRHSAELALCQVEHGSPALERGILVLQQRANGECADARQLDSLRR
jgi:hypothetical protein